MKQKMNRTLNIIIIFFTPLFCLIPGNAQYKIDYHVNFDWKNLTIDTLILHPYKKFLRVSVPNTEICLPKGEPEIPYKQLCFLVPDGAGDFKIKINNTSIYLQFISNYPIIPSQGTRSINDLHHKPLIECKSPIYSSSEIVREGIVLDEFYIDGSYHIVKVAIPGIGYAGKIGKIEFYDEIDIELEYSLNPQNAIAIYPTKTNTLTTNLSSIELNNDTIQNGGMMEISSKITELKEGFTIEKGGILIVH